jgi:large subunit ribosomal protein L4
MSLNVTILDKDLKKTETAFATLADYEVREKLLAQVIRSEMLSLRAGNAHVKTRAEVRGGGKKPWKQKGTGRARHGSKRSPIWVGGGVAWGPRNTVNWSRKINKTSRIAALKSLLKDRLSENSVYQFQTDFDYPKTKIATELINQLADKTKTKPKKMLVFYTTEEKEKLNGFPNTETCMINAGNLKIHLMAKADKFILTPKARELLETKVG